MARIKIENLPKDSKISEEELKGIRGGSIGEGVFHTGVDALGFDTASMEGVKLWSGRARAWSLDDGIRIEFKGS